MLGGAYHSGQPFASMRRSHRESLGSGRLSHAITAPMSRPAHDALDPPNAMQHAGRSLIGQHTGVADDSAPVSRGASDGALATDDPHPRRISERIKRILGP
jgi:hypothetical protein